MLLILFAFISGLLTIFAPCIWPLLPIVLSSKSTDHRRPLGLVIGISTSFALLTLSLSTLVRLFHFDPNTLRFVSVVIIAFMGLLLLVPRLSAWFETLVSRLSSRWGTRGQSAQNNFLSGLITGLSLGIVWSPCAGPILATIASLSATGLVSFTLIAITLAYSFGVALPLFIIAYGSQKIISKSRRLTPHLARLQQLFGLIMILTAVAIFTNYDKVVELKLLNIFPGFSSSITNIENNAAVTNELNQLKKQPPSTTAAPDFTGITHWLNTPSPLTMADLKGKVVLVDFWTYTCINCLRTLPHLTAWYDKYKDNGFVIIGVHTPEFEFEKDTANVQNAINQFNIHYPVAQDNDYATWNKFNNLYWPAEYLIDAQGLIRKTHFGEGNYEEMEAAIQSLLQENNQKVDTSQTTIPDTAPGQRLSPESYLGARRAQFYYPSTTITVGKNNFNLATNLPDDSFSFGGTWDITTDFATTVADSTLAYHFTASKVYLVLRPGPSSHPTVKVFIDDQLTATFAIDSDKLYPLVDLPGAPATHLLRLEFSDPGIQAFAFTFG